ncbi:flagellar filament capping protein FliD [Pantoea cypripedii]|uniref:Flagellar hook-associated protein 2 n=1 Tax=Pantoea cypripedii TaxID=55209 RepID=A0A6B9G2H6_PANCY|nr:flagellar filament capping protein FliD [Pantoea cypripedii]QGY31751.1 flagellar filament capping protein FliD [Pantoea cypripedii]
MVGISTLGIGSGLKLDEILTKLTTAEKQVLTPISKQQSAATAKLSAYGTLKTAIQNFQSANSKLQETGLYTQTNTVSSSTTFSAVSDGKAIPGKYTVSVTQLAQAQTLTSAAKNDIKLPAGSDADSRTLKISMEDGKEHNITLSKDQTSLSALRDTINKSNVGISASLIRVSDKEYRLSLTSTETGIGHAVKSLAVTGDDTLQSFIGYDVAANNNGMTQNVAAKNALLSINNVSIENSSNVITDAVEGVTLKLNDVTTGNQVLTVSSDSAKAKSAISDWVTSYNSLQDTIGNLTKYTPVDSGQDQDSKNGALLGDGTLRIIQTQLKSILANSSGSLTFKTMTQAGITSDPVSGKLKLDEDKLSSALSTTPEAIRDIFAGDGKNTGIATVMASSMTSILSSKGALQGATDSISKKLNALTDQYNKASQKIDNTIARYKTQFTHLDTMLSSLNSTSSYLTTQFENMTKSNNT